MILLSKRLRPCEINVQILKIGGTAHILEKCQVDINFEGSLIRTIVYRNVIVIPKFYKKIMKKICQMVPVSLVISIVDMFVFLAQIASGKL